MSSAGQQLIAGRIPGERIETQIRTVPSATFTTTETITDTVTAPLVIGRTYGITVFSSFRSTNGGDTAFSRTRQDNVSGTQLAVQRVVMSIVNSSFGYSTYAEFTAVVTGNKTFVTTGIRGGEATGTIDSNASATQQSVMHVEYIRG